MAHPSLDISVDCVVFGYDDDGLKVLLIEQRPNRAGSPTFRALPGDLIGKEEGLDAAAERVLFELTRLREVYLQQFHAFGDPMRVRDVKDQPWLLSYRERPEVRVVTVAYYALVSLHEHRPEPASFAGSVHWVDIHEIPDLAFDHNAIVERAFETLRDSLDTHRVSFELLPKKFTLSQLQGLYEIVLNKKFDKRNFRKKILAMDTVQELEGETKMEGFHRPAQLYAVKVV